jgi:RNA polymerase sigma-70 factor (ECF subfamily)
MRKLELFPERQLINRIQANDRSVLGELFVRYEKLITGYVTSHAGADADAQDMLQEAIVVLWQNVCSGKFEVRAKISTYLLGVVKNKWQVELRKRKKFEHQDTLDDRKDGTPSALDNIVAAERAAMVQHD